MVAVNQSIFNATEGKEVPNYMQGIGGCHEKQSHPPSVVAHQLNVSRPVKRRAPDSDWQISTA